MTNLPKFIERFLSEYFLKKLESRLKDIYLFTSEEKLNFVNKIRVVLCSEKCPCCGRICGL